LGVVQLRTVVSRYAIYAESVADSPRLGDADLAEQIALLQPRLYRFAWSLTKEAEEAADLAQETVVRALGSQWRFTPGTNLKAWLFRILRNLYLNRRRSASAHAETVPFDNLELNGGLSDRSLNPIEESVLLKAELAEVLAAFRSLPVLYAGPLHLTAVEQLTYAETARILDIPVGTVMSRVYRGRRLLLERLGERAR
jgi:RNA polymerase sigma-70 factor (ECF subfamily)